MLIELKKVRESVLAVKITVCRVNFDRHVNLRHLRKAVSLCEKHLAAVME